MEFNPVFWIIDFMLLCNQICMQAKMVKFTVSERHTELLANIVQDYSLHIDALRSTTFIASSRLETLNTFHHFSKYFFCPII